MKRDEIIGDHHLSFRRDHCHSFSKDADRNVPGGRYGPFSSLPGNITC